MPPRARFTTLVASQPSHRVPNLLTFRSVEDLSLTLAFALGVARAVTEAWTSQAPMDETFTLAGPRSDHFSLRRQDTGWQGIVMALDDV